MEKIYYLDNAATTRMFDEVKNVSSNFLCDEFYNPSAVYNKSVNVRRVVEDARRYILEKNSFKKKTSCISLRRNIKAIND